MNKGEKQGQGLEGILVNKGEKQGQGLEGRIVNKGEKTRFDGKNCKQRRKTRTGL